MVRVKSTVASHRRKRKIRRQAKGFVGDRKNYCLALEGVMRAMANNYRHRKHNKRNFRRLWLIRIGVAARCNGISYSKFICGLKRAGSEINRKMLSELAINDPQAFTAFACTAKAALA